MTRVRDFLLLFIAINFCTRVGGNIDRSRCCNFDVNTTSPEIGRLAAVQTISSVIRSTVIALTYNRISVAYHTQYYHRQDDANLQVHESNDNFHSNIGADGVQFLMLPFSAFMLAINLWKLLASAFHHSKHMARAYGMLTGHYLLKLCRKFLYQGELHIRKQVQLCAFGEVITKSLRRLLLSYTRILMCATAVVLQEPEATLRSRQFVTMWLLRLMQRHQSQQQQQEKGHQNLYIAHSEQHQKPNHPNCSEHCGNMFQKQSQSYTFSRNQQCQQTQQPREQIYKLLLLQHHLAIVSLFFVTELQYRVRGISATAATTKTALATNLSIYILCRQNYRRNKHRRRRKLQCIARYILWMSARRHLIRVLWQKLVIRRQKLGTESISATRSKLAVNAEQQCNIRRMCVDRFFHIGESVSNDCCTRSNCSSDNINYNATTCNNCCNYSNANGKKYKYNKNARCPPNTCSECSCCCYCCCHYCCCCCYCCCYHALLTCHYCCCCLCFCCYQQQHNNSTTNSGAKTNTKCSRKGFQQHANGATHQHNHQQLQYEQYTHKEYQQHKRQQQNVFYQQHTSNCYHRRRRRYFSASYTNLHSYCCCFFKWICWRHHSYIEYIEKIGISVEATLAAVASMRLFFQNYYQKCFHKLLLYLQYLHKHFKTLNLLTTPDSKLQKYQMNSCNCTQERCNRRCIRYVASTGHSMERYKRQFRDKDSIVPTAKQSKASAQNFKTITRNRPAKITLSRPERINVTLAKSRMYNLVFRRHWVWLIIGLIWLDGPIIAKGNNSSSSSPTALNYTPTYDKSNCNTNCTQAAIRISVLHSSDIDSPMSTKVLPNHLPTRQTPSGGSASSRDWNDRARGEETRRQSDAVRLESIKRQILSKLGLKKKPNVTHPLPKQFIWDTIYRADGISSVTDFDFYDNHRGREIVSKKTSKLLKYSTSQNKLINRAPRVENRALRAGLRVNFIDVADDVVGELVVSSENMYADDNIGALLDEHFHLHHNQKEHLAQSLKKKIKLNHYSDKGSTKVINNFNANGESIKMQTAVTAAASAQSVTDVFHTAPLSAHTENDIYEADDYFGSTQEIITFAEQGEMYKKHRLVEFSSPTHRIPEQQLHIRHAEIHIRIEKIYRTVSVAESERRAPNTKLKLWIFQLLAGDYTQQGFDQVARFCTSLAVKSHELGWQKLDLTETVRYWYERSPPGEKLRLLIDCTGCGQNFMFHLFDVYNRTQTKEEPKRPKNNHNKKKQQEQRRRSHHRAASAPHLDEATASGANSAVQKFRNLNKYWNSNVTDLTDKQRQNTHRSQQQQHFSNNYKYTPLSIRVNSNRNRKNHLYNTHALQRQKKEAAPITQTQIFKEFRHLEDRLNPNRPFLVLHTEPIRARRVRRRVIDCTSALHGQCCKESFYVSFKALGWDDWIIAPRGYFANYCRGDCSGPYRTPDTFQTFHAHFIEEYRKLGLLNGMQPCCAPVKFSSMSLIYYGDDGIIKRDLPKMVVDECGCP